MAISQFIDMNFVLISLYHCVELIYFNYLNCDIPGSFKIFLIKEPAYRPISEDNWYITIRLMNHRPGLSWKVSTRKQEGSGQRRSQLKEDPFKRCPLSRQITFLRPLLSKLSSIFLSVSYGQSQNPPLIACKSRCGKWREKKIYRC